MNEQKCFLLIGNSRWHWAIQKDQKWIFSHTSPIDNTKQSFPVPIKNWAAVGSIPNHLYLDPLKEIHIKDIPLLKVPPWIGIDRVLGGWGAFKKAKKKGIHKKGIIVADAGTIFSVTKITSNGEFDGGQLLPGIKLQQSAMTHGTKNLQQSEKIIVPKDKFPVITQEAMIMGSIQSLLGVLMQIKNETNMPIWLCGGDSSLLFEELKQRNADVVHHPNLVLEGMTSISDEINPIQDQK